MLLQRMQTRAPLQATRYFAPAERVASTSAYVSAFASTSSVARLHTTPRRHDHYKTLEVPRGASQQEIKTQFYKLSKKWHPDVNPDSENAVQKFQQVSEAYSTLGSETGRKEYDRSLSGSRHGAARGADRGSFRYASDNVARRASASYAWEYQQRHSPSRASSTRNSSASQGRSQYHEFGRGGAPDSTASSSMFEQFAQRERKKDAAAAARSSNAGRRAPSAAEQQEQEYQSASPLIRFAQVAGMIYIVFYFGYVFNWSDEPKRTSRRSTSTTSART